MDQLILFSIIRTTIVFIFVVFMVRLVGKKLFSQMTFTDFIVGVTLGSLTANAAAVSVWETARGAIISIFTLSILTVIIGYLSIKNITFRKIFESEPVVVISNGTIDDISMKKARYNISTLMTNLRDKNVFNVADVEFAILEPDGKLSIELKSQKRPLTPSDINIPTKYEGLLTELIIDGNLMEENLKGANLDKTWLDNELKNKGITSYENIFFAGLDTSGSMYISVKYLQNQEKHGQYGIE